MAANISLSPAKSVQLNRPCLFVFESNLRVLNYLKRTFSALYDLRLFSEERAFLRDLEAMHRPSLVLLAWDGITQSMPLFSRVRTSRPEIPVLILATVAEMADYEAFARLGAGGVVLKPFVDDSLEVAIAKHLLVHKEEVGEPREIRLEGGHAFVRSSKRMCEIEAQAQLVARSDIPVLILGESGTGKEIVAMYTHQMSRRSSRMFLKVNCAAMPADLLESELFGYERGAFTGALSQKIGRFEMANQGTLFLDEVGDIPLDLQPKLLRALQEKSFERLGGTKTILINVRLVAATNRNLEAAVLSGQFRSDLYYRLNGLSLMLPPLRERLDEIPAMANYFMRKGAKKYDLQPLTISPALLEAFARYTWPGNLRELENIINRYLILQDEKAVIAELEGTRSSTALPEKQDHVEAGGLKKLVRGLKGEAESSVIAGVLEETGWNRKAAANDLQISYKALLYKIKQYDLSPRSA